MSKLKRLSMQVALVCAGVAGASQAFAAFCPITPSSPSIAPHFASAKATIEASHKNMELSIAKDFETKAAALTEAIAVVTKQTVVSTDQLARDMMENTKVQQAAKQYIEQARAQTKIAEEYGPRGVGFNICYVLEHQKQTAEVAKNTQQAAAQMARTEITAAPGVYKSRPQSMATRLATHNELYCTADQVSSGLCPTEGKRAGKSLDASVLFVKAKEGSDEYNDKSAFIDNVIGLPDSPLPQREVATTAGQAYTSLKMRKDSGLSVAGFGLKWVQARHSEVGHDHSHAEVAKSSDKGSDKAKDEKAKDSKEKEPAKSEDARLAAAKDADKPKETTAETQKTENISLMAMMKKDVDRYFGGAQEHTEWVKYMVGATEKGAMQELVKISAFNLKILGDRWKAQQIKEAHLAALIGAEMYNSGAEADVDNLRRQMGAYNNTALEGN